MTIGLPGPGPAGSAAEGRASSPHAVNSGTRLVSLQQPARPPPPSPSLLSVCFVTSSLELTDGRLQLGIIIFRTNIFFLKLIPKRIDMK